MQEKYRRNDVIFRFWSNKVETPTVILPITAPAAVIKARFFFHIPRDDDLFFM